MSAELDEQQNASVGMTVGMIEVGILFFSLWIRLMVGGFLFFDYL
jgi:hypothetical protein